MHHIDKTVALTTDRFRATTVSAAAGQPSETIADRVATLLVDHIRKNRLHAGASLPSEVQTSVDLRVSRGVVREAYRTLSSAGWVDIGNGRAPRVGRISNRSLLQVVQHALWTDQASMEQILELRRAIEERAAELAAVHRSPVDIEYLRRLLVDMREAGNKIEAWVKADVRFHEVIGQATGNPLFALMTSALREAMGASIRAGLAARTPRPDFGLTVKTHAQIVEALDRRRPRDARRLVTRHYDEALAAVRRRPVESKSPARGPRRPDRPSVRRRASL
jgi:GntR family transcriptional repressor for pyruvate dehydrogenase complex